MTVVSGSPSSKPFSAAPAIPSACGSVRMLGSYTTPARAAASAPCWISLLCRNNQPRSTAFAAAPIRTMSLAADDAPLPLDRQGSPIGKTRSRQSRASPALRHDVSAGKPKDLPYSTSRIGLPTT